MAVVALIQFTQGIHTDSAGKAVLGAFGVFSAVTVTNGNNTNVTSWKIYLLDAPPDSTTFPIGSQPQILAQATNSTPTTAFTPDVAGTYRLMLEVSDGSTTDRDIRCFGIPDARGFVRPPYQSNPDPLPTALPGIIALDPRPVKPDEQNYSTNVRGWAGNGVVGQLDQFLREYDDLPTQDVTTTPFTADETGGPFYTVNVTGSPQFILPLNPRRGFVVRVLCTSDPVLISPQGGGTIDAADNVTLKTYEGSIFVHTVSNSWLILARGSQTGSSVDPLSNVFFVDKGTSASTHDGSIVAPFSTITDALTAVPTGATILVTPGDYSSEGTLAITQNVKIAAFTPTAVAHPGSLTSIFNGLVNVTATTLSSSVILYLFGVTAGTVTLASSATVILQSSEVASFAGPSGAGNIVAWNSTLAMPIDVSRLQSNANQIVPGDGDSIINVVNADLDLSETFIDQSTAVTITFTGAGGHLNIDGVTNYWITLLAAGSGFTLVNGVIRVVDVSSPPVIPPLFNYMFVDPGTTVASGLRNGSSAAPFKFIQDAITGLGSYPSLSSSFTILCSAPSFESLTPGSGSYSLTLISDSAEYLSLGSVSQTANRLTMSRFVLSSDLSNSGIVEAINTNFGGDVTGSEVQLTGSASSSTGHVVTGTVTSSSTAVSAIFYTLAGPVVCATTLTLTSCDVQGDLTTADGFLTNCTMNGQTITVTGVLTVDVATYNSMVASSVVVTGGGTIKVLLPAGARVSSIAWDASSPITVTALLSGHAPGTYLVSGLAVVRTGATTGTVARGIAWHSPTLGADTITSAAASVTAVGSTLTDANFVASNGTANIDLTFTPASITGTPVIDLYVGASLQNTP